MRRLSLFALAVALPATSTLPALAQSGTVVDLDAVVLAASLMPVEAGRTGASVAVLDEATLRRAGEARVLALLDGMAGLSIRTNGPIGTVSSFSIRGASGNYIKVLQDGIDISDPSGPQARADLGALTAGALGRVEVVKGAQSAIHGANALGGVVALSTPRPTRDGIEQVMRAEVGSYRTASLSYGLTHRQGGNEAALTLSHLRSAGFSAAAGGAERDGHRGSRLTFRLARELANGLRIGVNGFASRERSDYDPEFYYPVAAGATVPVADYGWGPTIDLPQVTLGDGMTHDEVNTYRSHGLRLFAEWSAAGFDHEFAVSTTRFQRHSTGTEMDLDWSSYVPGAVTGTAVPVLTDVTYTGQRRGLSYRASGEVAAGLRLAFGGEWSRESYRQAGTWGTGSGRIRNGGVFGEMQWAASDSLDLSAALRHDRHSDFGGMSSGRLALAWRLGHEVTLRAQLGTGYRAPSSYERFAPFFGNAALRPERSRSADLGIERRFGDRGYLRATAFLLNVDNLIDYDFATSTYQQVPGTSRRRGIEIEGEFALSERVTLGGSYTHIASPTSTGPGWAIAPPRNAVVLNLGVRLGERVNAGLGIRHAAGRSQGLPDYTVLNAALDYELAAGASAYLRLENLTNRRYQTVPGYATAGRSIHLGLRRSF